MKPTKMRNQQIYRASLRTRSNQLGSNISPDLRKKYGKRSIRVVKGDTVKVMRGEYRGVDGKVSRVSTETNCVAIEGVKKEKSKGEKFDVLIHTSNLMIMGFNTDDPWRKNKLENKPKKSAQKEIKSEEIKIEKPEIEAPEQPKKEEEKPQKIQKKAKTEKTEQLKQKQKQPQKPPVKTKIKPKKSKPIKKNEEND